MKNKPLLTLSNFKKAPLTLNPKITPLKNTEPIKVKDITKVKTEVTKAKKQSTKDKSETKPINKDTSLVQANTSFPANKVLLRNKDYYSILKHLQTNYPKCFVVETPTPLAVGIHKHLLGVEDLPFSRTKLRAFLKRYTKSKLYRNTLILGNDRFDLNGVVTSQILEEEIPQAKVSKDQDKEGKSLDENTDVSTNQLN